MASDMLDVTVQDALFHTGGADHVIRNKQKLLAACPFGMTRDHVFHVLDRPSSGVTFQDELQDCHEVALPAAEAAVQVTGLALILRHRPFDESQGIVECLHQLIRSNVR